MEEFPRLKKRSDYTLHVNSTISTSDNQDHAYHGIMFDVEVKTGIPIEQLSIQSVWARGRMGKICVYTIEGSHENKYSEELEWRQIYSKKHHESVNKFVEFKFSKPLVLKPGSRHGLYIHSRSSQEAVIYDDERNAITFENCFIKIHSGLACTSHEPFGPTSGSMDWHWPWRPNREFVGKISFGVRYRLWRPIASVNNEFSMKFQRGVLETVKCFRSGKMGFKLYKDVLFLILNMLPFDWFEEGESKLELEDTRRTEGERIGWSMSDDWTLYRGRILTHREKFLKRKGLLTSNMYSDNRQWFYSDDESDDSSYSEEDEEEDSHMST